jgi:hypothetical protein
MRRQTVPLRDAPKRTQPATQSRSKANGDDATDVPSPALGTVLDNLALWMLAGKRLPCVDGVNDRIGFSSTSLKTVAHPVVEKRNCSGRC